MEKNVKRIVALVIAVIICQLAGVVGSIFTFPNISTWYAGIVKPFFAPPNWLFGPVWTILYFLMGVALYLVWEKGFFKPKAAPVKEKAKIALWLFALQLTLNVIWSYLFFGLRNPLAGLVEILIMWVTIGFTIRAFYPVSRKAAWMLVPYILWVSIATLLNAAIVILN